MSLDEKLKSILTQYHYKGAVERLHASKDIEAIKQAFIDEGWVLPIALTKEQAYDKTKHEIYRTPRLMTGAEWLARFEKELDGEISNDEDAIDAARRAAGVDE